MTPLHFAAFQGNPSVVEVLIRSHADINAIGEVSEYIHNYNKQFCTVQLKLLRATYYRLS